MKKRYTQGRPIVLRAELLRRFAPLAPTPKTKHDGMGAAGVHCQQERDFLLDGRSHFSQQVENQTQKTNSHLKQLLILTKSDTACTVAGRLVAVVHKVLSFWFRAWRSLFTTLSAGGVIKAEISIYPRAHLCILITICALIDASAVHLRNKSLPIAARYICSWPIAPDICTHSLWHCFALEQGHGGQSPTTLCFEADCC
jgi:hypothetical protein